MAAAIPKDVELPTDVVSPLELLEELSQTNAEERGATPRPSKATMLFITAMSAAKKHQFDQAFQKMMTSVQEAEKEASHKEPLGISLLGLGFLSYAIGKYEQAEMCYVRSLEIWDAVHGKDNPKLARILADTATVCEKQKKYQQALECLERASVCKTKGSGDKSPEVQGLACALANVHARLGHFDQAETLFKSAIAQLKELKHPSVVAALSMYHKVLVARGPAKAAEAAAVEAELNALKK